MKLIIILLIGIIVLSGCTASDNYYTPSDSDYGYCIKACTGGSTSRFDDCHLQCKDLAKPIATEQETTKGDDKSE